MRIIIPRECKVFEGRVALSPAAVGELVRAGHEVCVEVGAGHAAGYADDAYQKAGAGLQSDRHALYAEAALIVKVKEPQVEEWPLLHAGHRLFSYLHLAAAPDLLQALQQRQLTAVAFEAVQESGRLPLLAPMSRIAGELAIQWAMQYLSAPMGGKGLLLQAIPGCQRARVLVLGGGVAGTQAALTAARLGAQVTVVEKRAERWPELESLHPGITACPAQVERWQALLAQADVLVGAVLDPGARAPCLVDRNMVRSMQAGSVIVDIAIDQGGCIETMRATTYADPVYCSEGVLHCGVSNLPGAVPRTSSEALSAALLPYVLRLAAADWRQDAVLAAAIQVADGSVVAPVLRRH